MPRKQKQKQKQRQSQKVVVNVGTIAPKRRRAAPRRRAPRQTVEEAEYIAALNRTMPAIQVNAVPSFNVPSSFMPAPSLAPAAIPLAQPEPVSTGLTVADRDAGRQVAYGRLQTQIQHQERAAEPIRLIPPATPGLAPERPSVPSRKPAVLPPSAAQSIALDDFDTQRRTELSAKKPAPSIAAGVFQTVQPTPSFVEPNTEARPEAVRMPQPFKTPESVPSFPLKAPESKLESGGFLIPSAPRPSRESLANPLISADEEVGVPQPSKTERIPPEPVFTPVVSKRAAKNIKVADRYMQYYGVDRAQANFMYEQDVDREMTKLNLDFNDPKSRKRAQDIVNKRVKAENVRLEKLEKEGKAVRIASRAAPTTSISLAAPKMETVTVAPSIRF